MSTNRQAGVHPWWMYESPAEEEERKRRAATEREQQAPRLVGPVLPTPPPSPLAPTGLAAQWAALANLPTPQRPAAPQQPIGPMPATPPQQQPGMPQVLAPGQVATGPVVVPAPLTASPVMPPTSLAQVSPPLEPTLPGQSPLPGVGGQTGVVLPEVLTPEGRTRPYPLVRPPTPQAPPSAPQQPQQWDAMESLVNALRSNWAVLKDATQPIASKMPAPLGQGDYTPFIKALNFAGQHGLVDPETLSLALLAVQSANTIPAQLRANMVSPETPDVEQIAPPQDGESAVDTGLRYRKALNKWMQEKVRPVVDWFKTDVAQPLSGLRAYEAAHLPLVPRSIYGPILPTMGAYRALTGKPAPLPGLKGTTEPTEKLQEQMQRAYVDPEQMQGDIGETWRSMGRLEREMPWWWRMPWETVSNPVNWAGFIGSQLMRVGNTTQVVDAAGRVIGSPEVLGLSAGVAETLPMVYQPTFWGQVAKAVGGAATTQNVGRVLYGIDLAENIGTWATASDEELPAMIATAAIMRFGTDLLNPNGTLRRWYRGEGTPSEKNLAAAMQAEWELSYREQGMTPPDTITVRRAPRDAPLESPFIKAVAEDVAPEGEYQMPVSRAFRRMGELLHDFLRQGHSPPAGSMAETAVRNAAEDTPEARMRAATEFMRQWAASKMRGRPSAPSPQAAYTARSVNTLVPTGQGPQVPVATAGAEALAPGMTASLPRPPLRLPQGETPPPTDTATPLGWPMLPPSSRPLTALPVSAPRPQLPGGAGAAAIEEPIRTAPEGLKSRSNVFPLGPRSTGHAIPGTDDHRLWSYTPPGSTEVDPVEHERLANQPYVAGLTNALGKAHDMLVGAWQAGGGRPATRFGGALYSTFAHGVFAPTTDILGRATDATQANVLINLWSHLRKPHVRAALASYRDAPGDPMRFLTALSTMGKAYFGSLAHEIAHSEAPVHGGDFAAVLDRLPDEVGAEAFGQTLQTIYSAVGNVLRNPILLNTMVNDATKQGRTLRMSPSIFMPPTAAERAMAAARGERLPEWIDPTGQVVYHETGAPSGMAEESLPGPEQFEEFRHLAGGLESGEPEKAVERGLGRSRDRSEGTVLGDDAGLRGERPRGVGRLRTGVGAEGPGDAGRGGADEAGGVAPGPGDDARRAAAARADEPARQPELPGVVAEVPQSHGKLIAIHNLTEQNLIEADRLGGMPVPSIGIARAGQPHASFGDISLIAPRSMVDPQLDSRAKVYDADIWSPTRPVEEWPKPPAAQVDKVTARLLKGDRLYRHSGTRGEASEILDALHRFPNRRKAIDLIRQSAIGRLAFLQEQGVTIEPVMRPVTGDAALVQDEALLDWYDQHRGELDAFWRSGGEGFDQHPLAKELYEQVQAAWLRQRPTRNAARFAALYQSPTTGNLALSKEDKIMDALRNARRSTQSEDWRATSDEINKAIAVHGGENALREWAEEITDIFAPPTLKLRGRAVPYTLANIVEAMTLRKHGEHLDQGVFGFGSGQARAVGAQQLRSIEAMHAASDRLSLPEDVRRYSDEVLNPALRDYERAVMPLATGVRLSSLAYSNKFGEFSEKMSAAMRVLGDYLKGGHVKRSPQRMRQTLSRNGFVGADDRVIEAAIEAAEAVRDHPVSLFEAKPQRAVSIGEFAAAVIPGTTGPVARDVLRRHNVPTMEYDPSDEASRRQAIDAISEDADLLFEHIEDKQEEESKRPYYHAQSGEYALPDDPTALQGDIMGSDQLPPRLHSQIEAARRIATGTYSWADANSLTLGANAWLNRFPPDDPIEKNQWINERKKHPWGDIWADVEREAGWAGITDHNVLYRRAAERWLRRARVFGFMEPPPTPGLKPHVGKMLAIHNTRASNLIRTLALGGFPMPSLAVTRGDAPAQMFGDITFVARRQTVDPEAYAENQVFSADAWTPTVPHLLAPEPQEIAAYQDLFAQRLTDAVPLDRLSKMMRDGILSAAKDTQAALTLSRQDAISVLDDSGLGKILFFLDRALPIPGRPMPPGRPSFWQITAYMGLNLKTQGLERDYRKWLREFLADYPKSKLLASTKPAGKFLPATAENIVEEMRRHDQQMDIIEAAGPSAMRGALARQLPSVEAMRAEAGRLVTREEDSAALDAMVGKIEDAVMQAIGYADLETAENVMRDYFALSTDGPDLLNLRFALYDNAPGEIDPPGIAHEKLETLMGLLEEFRRLPDVFMEAKPQRVVGFDEWAAVLVPDEVARANPEMLRDLEDAGTKKIVPYRYHDENSWKQALNDLVDEDPDILFERIGEEAEGEDKPTPPRYVMLPRELTFGDIDLYGQADNPALGALSAFEKPWLVAAKGVAFQWADYLSSLERAGAGMTTRLETYRALLYPGERDYFDAPGGEILSEWRDVERLLPKTWFEEYQVWETPDGFRTSSRFGYTRAADLYSSAAEADVRKYLQTGVLPAWYASLDATERMDLSFFLAESRFPIEPDDSQVGRSLSPQQVGIVKGLWQRAYSSPDWYMMEFAKVVAGSLQSGLLTPDDVADLAQSLSRRQALQLMVWLADGIPPLKRGLREADPFATYQDTDAPAWDIGALLGSFRQIEDLLLDDRSPDLDRAAHLAEEAQFPLGDLALIINSPEIAKLVSMTAQFTQPGIYHEPEALLRVLLPSRINAVVRRGESLTITRGAEGSGGYDFERGNKAGAVVSLLQMDDPATRLHGWLLDSYHRALPWVQSLDPELRYPSTPAEASLTRFHLLTNWANTATDDDNEDVLTWLLSSTIRAQGDQRVLIAAGKPTPDDITNKAANVRSLAQGRLETARPPEEVRRTAPEGVHTDAQVGYVEGYERVDALQRYAGNMDEIMSRELLQNMVDASRGQGEREVSLEVWTPQRVLVAKDHGVGMTPEQVVNEFVKIGATEKTAGSSGGKGSAKTALLGNADVVFVRTVALDPATGKMMDTIVWGTGDEYLTKGVGLTRASYEAGKMPQDILEQMPEVIANNTHWLNPDGSWRTGTIQAEIARPETYWGSQASLAKWADSVLNAQRLEDISLSFRINDQNIVPQEPKTWLHQTTLVEGPVEMEIYFSDQPHLLSECPVTVLNHGLPQYDMLIYLGSGKKNTPNAVVVNVISHVHPQDPNDPWTADRRSLTPRYMPWVDWVRNEITNAHLAHEQRRLKVLLRDEAPVIMQGSDGSDLRLVSEKDLPMERLQEIAARDYVRAFAQMLDAAHQMLGIHLADAVGSWESVRGRSHPLGLGISNRWLGINIKPDMIGGQQHRILLNPWALLRDSESRAAKIIMGVKRAHEDIKARRVPEIRRALVEALVDTLYHEIVHDRYWDHGDEFSGVVGGLGGAIGTRKRLGIEDELEEILRPALESAAQLDEILKDDGALRAASEKEGLQQYGSKRGQEGVSPHSVRADEGGVGEPGAGVLPVVHGRHVRGAGLQPGTGETGVQRRPGVDDEPHGGGRPDMGADEGLSFEQAGSERLEGAAGGEEPRAVEGKETWSFGLVADQRMTHRYKVVELNDLVVSHTLGGSENPDYPQELQPRDRTRTGSAQWVHEVAAKLDPDRLLFDGHRLDDGPPIVNDNLQVESGNGRVLAISLAQRDHRARYDAYRAALLRYAEEYGLDTAAIANMTTPVLVRERLSPVEDMAAYVDTANKPQIQQRSAAEQARADARLVSDDMLSDLYIEGETDIREALKQKRNQDIVYEFANQLTPEERNAMITADGDLSPEGFRRFMNALYTRTFRSQAGRALVNLLIESQEPGMKLIERAMVGSLGAMAKAEGLMASGDRYPTLSLAHTLSRVLVHLQALRRSGMPVKKYLETQALFITENEPTEFERWMLELLNRLVKSPTRLRDLLTRYAQLVVESPDPKQGSLLGAAIAPAKEDLLKRAIEDVAQERGEKIETWLTSDVPADPGVMGLLGEREIDPDAYPADRGRWAHNSNWNVHANMVSDPEGGGKIAFGHMVMMGGKEVFVPGVEMDIDDWTQEGTILERERLLREMLPADMRAKAKMFAQIGADLSAGIETERSVNYLAEPGITTGVQAEAAPVEAQPGGPPAGAPPAPPTGGPPEPPEMEEPEEERPKRRKRATPAKPKVPDTSKGQIKALSSDGSMGAVVQDGQLVVGAIVRRGGRQVMRPEARIPLGEWFALGSRMARERLLKGNIEGRFHARIARYMDVAERAIDLLVNPAVTPSATIEGLRFTGDRPAWRVETGYRHPEGTTAADVLEFERDEHGNALADMNVNEAILKELAERPASDVVWVTFSRENALRYTDAEAVGEGVAALPEQYPLGDEARLLASDGEGGYLVLLGKRTATPMPSDALTDAEREALEKAGYRAELLDMLTEDEVSLLKQSVASGATAPEGVSAADLQARAAKGTPAQAVPPQATPQGLESIRQIFFPRDKFKGRGRRSIGKQVHYAGLDVTINRAMLDALAQRGYTDQQIESMWPEDVAFIYTNDVSPMLSAKLAKYTGETIVRYQDGPVDDLQRLNDAISDGKPKKGEPPDSWWMRFRMAWTDRVAPLGWLGEQVGSEVYAMARMVPGMAMRGESMVERYVMPVLKDLSPEELIDLEYYMTLWRMIDLKNIDPNIVLPGAVQNPRAAMKQLIAKIGGDQGLSHPKLRKIALAAQRLWNVNQQVLLQRAFEGGRISEKALEILLQKHPHYLPFYREGMPEDLDVFGSFTSAQVANLEENFLKYLSETGSTKPVENPLARWVSTIIKNEVDIARNETAREMVRALEQWQEKLGQQIVFRGGTQMPATGKVVWWEEGERNIAWIPQIFANVARALDKEPANVLTSMFTPLANILRMGATQLNLPFTVTNAIRDFMTAWYNEGLNPFGDAYWKGWLAALTHNDTWHEAAEAGVLGAGMSDTYRSLRDIDRRSRQLTFGVSVRNWQEALALIPRTWAIGRHMTGLLGDMAKQAKAGDTDAVEKMLRRVFHDANLLAGAGPNLILSLNEVVETATRLGGYLHIKKKGLSESEARLRAREITIDFARAGSAMQMVNRVIPFTNAQEQAAIKTAQVLKRDPLRALLVSIPFVLASLLFFAYNKRYESAKDIPDYEYLYNWIVIVDEVELPPDPAYPDDPPRMAPLYLRIPKGPIGSMFTAVPEATMRIAWQYNDRTALENLARAAKAMVESISPIEFNPTLAAPLPFMGPAVETLVNRNLYTGREIVPEYEKSSRPPEERFGPGTSTTVVGLMNQFNKALEALGIEGISPRKADYFIRATTAGTGEQALWLIDLITQAMGYRPEAPGEAYQREMTKWEELSANPFTKRFVGMRSNERERIEWEDVKERVPQIQRAYYRNAEVKRFGIGMTLPGTTLSIDGAEYRLSPSQRGRIMERTADLAIPAQQAMIRTDTYKGLSDKEKDKALRRIKDKMQDYAREELIAEITGEDLETRWRPSQMADLVKAWEQYQGYIALDPSAMPLTPEEAELAAEAEAGFARIRRANPRMTEAQVWLAYVQQGGRSSGMQIARRQARVRNPEREQYLWEHPLIQKYGWAR